MNFTLVSDLDDTIKITHTTHRLRTILRGLFTREVFAGMPELYQEWVGREGEFIVISSSPRSIHAKIHRFLKKSAFPAHQIWLRDWIRQPKIKEYKQQNFERLGQQFEGPFMLIGDDSEYDPEVFTEFSKKNPGRVTQIYIRQMRARPLPEGCLPFYTAFDIALNEYRQKRLKIPQVSRVAKAILDEPFSELVIPTFAPIPAEVLGDEVPATLEQLRNQIEEKYRRIAADRQAKSSGRKR